MRKILVVVAVISGAACLEVAPQSSVTPAPQPPVSTATLKRRTQPPVGRIEVVEAQRTDPLSDLERTYGPVIASGIEAGQTWSMRGSIGARGAKTWLQTDTGGGGGGGGALPFQDLGWKKLGHFGSFGSGDHQSLGAPRILDVIGVVSKQTAAIEVRLADGTSLPAQIIDTGDARANFFVAVWSVPVLCEVMTARDAAGAELESYRLPPPRAHPPPAIPSQGSSTQITATRAAATATP